MYKVIVNAWTADENDYIDGEYSGTVYATREEAEQELEEARREYGLDSYIREV